MEKKRNIIDVIPLTRIPLGRNQSFSYLAEEKIAPGTLVIVPLFKRKVEGIVTAARPDFARLGNIELKKVEKILEEKFLEEKQIQLAKFISDYYISPLGIVLKSFVPKRVKARIKLTTASSQAATKKIILTSEQKLAVDAVAKKYTKYHIQNSKYFLYGPSGSGKTEVYIHSILKLRQQNPDLQFLILLPELTLTPQAIERYGQYFPAEETAILHSRIAKGKFYTDWQKIKRGEVKIIIGSRMAVFAPFKKLGLIVVDEEQDMSYKQWDMNPRYDARLVAEKIAEIYSAKILFGSATPGLETYFQATIGQAKLLALSSLVLPGQTVVKAPEVSIIDMRKERWKDKKVGPANFSPLSRKLQAEISYALKNKLQIILFVNRQGMSSFSICMSCKSVLQCPQCERALVYENKGSYKCLHCAYRTSITPSCAKCHGLAFSNIGLGTQKVEREVADFFASARVARVDNQTMQNPDAQEKTYRAFADGEIDILIGTQMITKGWDLPNVGLVGIIDADNLLSIPDFSASIRAYQNIVQVAGRTGRPGSKWRGVVLIQTFNPENFVFKAAAERDFEKLYQKEIVEREALSFPPFGKFIKIIFQDSDNQKAEKEALRTYGLLEQLHLPGLTISEVHMPMLSKVRGRFRKQVIIKIPQKYQQDIPVELRGALERLPAGWIIDVDPISLV